MRRRINRGSWSLSGLLLGFVLLLMGGPAYSADAEEARKMAERYDQITPPAAPKPAPAPKSKPRAQPKPEPEPAPPKRQYHPKPKPEPEPEPPRRSYRPKPRPAPVIAPEAEQLDEEVPSTPTTSDETYQTRSQPFEPEMVQIKAGCFQMGSPANEPGRYDNERQHEVCIQTDYEIGKYEVTQGEWRAVMGSNPSEFKQGNRYPVENVSWNDIQDYLTKLNQKTGKNYRLPTEAEWEYAARAGTRTPFWTGRCVTTAQANYNGNYSYGEPDCGAKTEVHRQKPQAVGSYPANPWGLYDTMGNVWEWTCSLYNKEYNGSEQKCSNIDTDGPRALRGGPWYIRPAGVRSANRDRVAPAFRNGIAGFRLARSL